MDGPGPVEPRRALAPLAIALSVLTLRLQVGRADSTGARQPRGPERFLTTVLMTDMVGSTEHAAELGDHGWRELLDLITPRPGRPAAHRGREIDTAGDGFFATFDAPAPAVAFALEIVDESSNWASMSVRASTSARSSRWARR